MFRIRQIEQKEIPLLKNFPPKDWNLDIPKLFSFHYGYPYFYPAVAEVDKKIVGCGIANVNGTIGWLGTIIVLPEYRGQGIGTGITSHLVEYCKGKGSENQVLVASEMGEPVYRKLGFTTSATYVFYKREPAISIQTVTNVREIKKEDIKYIKELDKKITGEERFVFIERFLSTGWVYDSGNSDQISGVYLPDYGTGLVIAKDPEAGLALVKLRFNQGQKKIVIPSTNIIVKDFLLSNGFQEYRRAPRMVLGEDANWIPSMVYNRGTGYCG